MKKRVKRKRVILFVAFIFCFFLALEAHAFRCGDEVVGTGDSKASVLIKCGKPTVQEKVGAKKITHTKGQKRGAIKQDIDTRRASAKSVEKWTYNCGKDDFIYVLTFEGGVMTREDTDGRGRGASECLGR